MSRTVEISAIVPVCEVVEPGTRLAREYLAALEETGKSFELAFVLDGAQKRFLDELAALAEEDGRIRIIQLAKTFGEAAALSAGFEFTTGEIILTLPAYSQVPAEAIGTVLAGLDHADVAVACRRSDRGDGGGFQRMRRKLYNRAAFIASRESFSDISCGVRAFKRDVADELPLYGDQYRFFPILAARRGFKVREVPVEAADGAALGLSHGPRVYLARLLDIFALIFLVRFTKKPLRFFGTIGTAVFAIGAVFLSLLVVERLFFGVALADRPALLLSSLLVVLGLQVFALGLLGELIIFTHAKDMKEYTIERIVN